MNVLMLRGTDMCSFLWTKEEQIFAFCIVKSCAPYSSACIEVC